MTTFFDSTLHRGAAARLLVTASLLALGGCKPAPPATTTSQAVPPAEDVAPRQPGASSQPSARDFQTFLQSFLTSAVKVSEVKLDPPARPPNAAPGTNAWILSVKVTLVPAEDLFALPAAADTRPIEDLAGELNALISWRNTYVHSPYAKACGELTIQVPAAPLPQLLVVKQAKDKPLPPLYGKVAAEWQVDHWQFESIDLNPPAFGGPRASFQGATMVQGSPQAEQALREVRDAIVQARKDIDAVRTRYAEQVSRGTKPGTTYTGTVSYRQNTAACELKFLDAPPPSSGGSNSNNNKHLAAFQVTLTSQNPPCWYTYQARVSTELPIPIPGTPPSSTTTNPYAVTGFNDAQPVSTCNVFQHLVRSSNFKVGRDTLASYLGSNDHGGQGLLLLDGRMNGLINDFGNPGVQLAVQQKP